MSRSTDRRGPGPDLAADLVFSSGEVTAALGRSALRFGETHPLTVAEIKALLAIASSGPDGTVSGPGADGASDPALHSLEARGLLTCSPTDDGLARWTTSERGTMLSAELAGQVVGALRDVSATEITAATEVLDETAQRLADDEARGSTTA